MKPQKKIQSPKKVKHTTNTTSAQRKVVPNELTLSDILSAICKDNRRIAINIGDGRQVYLVNRNDIELLEFIKDIGFDEGIKDYMQEVINEAKTTEVPNIIAD